MDYEVHRLANELIDRVRQEPDGVKRLDLIREVEAYISGEAKSVLMKACQQLIAEGWRQPEVAAALGVHTLTFRRRMRAWCAETGEPLPQSWWQDRDPFEGAVTLTGTEPASRRGG